MEQQNLKRRRQVIATLYSEHSKRICAFFKHKTSDDEAARELTHDTFMKLLERSSIETMDPVSQKSYLQKCARNNLVDYYKRKEKYFDLVRKLHMECSNTEPADTTEENHIKNDFIQYLNNFIRKSFSSTEREILFRRYYKNESLHSISSSTGISRYKIERALHSISGRIRENISQYY